MKTFGKLLAALGLLLLIGAWQLELLFQLTGLEERLIEEGGKLHYNFHLERNRMVALSVGASALFLGAVLYLGARVIERNEAAQDRRSSAGPPSGGSS